MTDDDIRRDRIVEEISRLLGELGIDLDVGPFVIGTPGARGVYALTIGDLDPDPAGHEWQIVENADPSCCSCDWRTIVAVLESALGDARDEVAKAELAEHAGLN